MQDDVASTWKGGNARVLVDPRSGSRFAHNVNRLSRPLSEGKILYCAGHGLQEPLRQLDYTEVAPGILVSHSRVAVEANGLDARFFVYPESRISSSVEPVENKEIVTVFDAIRARRIERILLIDDDPSHHENIQKVMGQFGIPVQIFTQHSREANEALKHLSDTILVMTDDWLNDFRQGPTIVQEAAEFTDGLIIWYSGNDPNQEAHNRFPALLEKRRLWPYGLEIMDKDTLKQLAEAIMDSQKTHAAHSQPEATPIVQSSLPITPYSEVYSLLEAIEANGFPKDIVMYGWDIMAQTDVDTLREGGVTVDIYISGADDRFEEFSERVFQLGSRALVMIHNHDLLRIKQLIMDPRFKGILYFKTGGAQEDDDFQGTIADIQEQYKGRLFLGRGPFYNKRYLLNQLIDFNSRAKQAMARQQSTTAIASSLNLGGQWKESVFDFPFFPTAGDSGIVNTLVQAVTLPIQSTFEILAVDDDPQQPAVYQRAIGDGGMVRGYSSVRLANGAVRDHPFNLLIVDLMLDGAPRAEEIVREAIAHAMQPFHLMIVSGATSRNVSSIQTLVEENIGRILSFNAISKTDAPRVLQQTA